MQQEDLSMKAYKGMHAFLRPTASASQAFKDAVAAHRNLIVEVLEREAFGTCALLLPQGIALPGFSKPIPEQPDREMLHAHESYLRPLNL